MFIIKKRKWIYNLTIFIFLIQGDLFTQDIAFAIYPSGDTVFFPSTDVTVRNVDEGVLKKMNSQGIVFYEAHVKERFYFGARILRYQDGRISEQEYWAMDGRQGLYNSYFRNGQIKDSGSYHLGEKIGLWKQYYSNEKLKSTGSYDNGLRIGKWSFYSESGELLWEENYSQGLRKEEWINNNLTEKSLSKYKKLFSGEVNSEGNRTGKWTFLYINGEIRATGNYLNGQKTGKWKYFYESGIEQLSGSYKNGLRVGFWTLSTDDKRLSTSTILKYKKGKLKRSY